MAKIRIKGRVGSLYKESTAFVISIVITAMLVDRHFDYLSTYAPTSSLAGFFNQSSLLIFYITIIGLMLAAYSILVAMLPHFSGESLRQPIFGQLNRLFMFTILSAILLMIADFLNSVLNFNTFAYFEDLQAFLFILLMTGLVFSVFALSDIFNLVRKRGEK